jgi:hypothetical protein
MNASCPHCGQSGQTPDEGTVRCPHCGRTWTIEDDPEEEVIPVRRRSPVLVAAVVAFALVFALGFVALLVVAIAANMEKAGETAKAAPLSVKGNYPPPVSKYNGFNVEFWYEKAQDLNDNEHERACTALEQMGAEAIPALLATLKRDTDRWGMDSDRSNETLTCIDGSLIDVSDLPIILEYVTKQPAKTKDTTFPGLPRRITAANILGKAGPKARGCIPQFRKVLSDPKIDKNLRGCLQNVIDQISGAR